MILGQVVGAGPRINFGSQKPSFSFYGILCHLDIKVQICKKIMTIQSLNSSSF